MAQSFKSCFILAFLSAVLIGLALGNVAEPGTRQFYWKTMLPNTPMPQALLNALPISKNADGAAEGNKALNPTTGKYHGQAPLSQKVDEYGYEPPSPSAFLKQDFVTSMFFQEKDLVPGTKFNIHFKNDVQGPPFPSSSMAQKMPSLTARNLPQLLQLFSVDPNSKTAKIMNQTIVRCEHPNPINGRLQFCATSIQKLVNLVTSEFGDSRRIKAVSMPSTHTDALIPYKIMGFRQIAAEQSLIACHKLSFPVGLYYCHQPRGAVAYAVSLARDRDGVKTDVYAMCHRRTADWSPEYIAFMALGVKPGATICHFNQPDNVIWYRV